MRSVVLAAILAAGLGTATIAGPNAGHKIAVHVVEHGVACKSLPAITRCSDIVTAYPGTGDIDVIPVFYGLAEVRVVEFGLLWPAEWGTCTYTRCWGDYVVGGIIEPGDGVATAAFACDSSWAVLAGYGWLHASGPGTVSIIPNPATLDAGVVNCAHGHDHGEDHDNAHKNGHHQPEMDPPSCTISARVGGGPGADPCAGTLSPLGLALDNGLSGACAARGDRITYTLTVGNPAGHPRVDGVFLVDDYAPSMRGLEFVAATSGGKNKPRHGQVAWSIGSLAPGETASVEVSLRVLPWAPDTIYNRARLTGDRCALSEAVALTPVCGRAREPLELSASDGLGGSCVASGEQLTYTLSYANPEGGAVHNAVLINRLPAQVELVSASAGGDYDQVARAVTWPLGDLAQGASGSRSVTVMVAASAGNTLNGACEIRADGAAGNLAALSTQVCGEHPRNPDHKLAIHVRRHGTTCSTLPAFASCRDIATTYAGCGDLDFIPVFFDLNEVTAVDFGVTWPAEWGSCVFALCPCDTWIGGIQKPGDGLGASWDSCKRSWAVAPGYGWLRASGPGLISPVAWGPYKELGVWNCGRAEKCRHDSTTALLPAGVCGGSGGDPCEPVVPRPAGAGVIEHPPR